MNKNELKLTNRNSEDILQWKYMNVLAMDALGIKYETIAEKTGYSYGYIKQLFMKGGKLYDLKLQFRQIAHRESIEEAFNIIFGGLPDVVRTMVETGKLPFDMVGVAAGKTIMEYGLGKAAERAKDSTGQGDTTADLVMRVELRRKQNESDRERKQLGSGMEGQPTEVSG